MAHDEVSPGTAGLVVGDAKAMSAAADETGVAPTRMHVHLGVHKTATTFIQSQLHEHREVLAERGIGYARIADVRNQFTMLFDRFAWADAVGGALTRPMLARRLEQLIQAHGKGSSFILSDENLLGLIAANYRTGRLYPGARRRLMMLDALLSGRQPRYFLSIRRYPDYLTSSWLQFASRGNAPAFDQYLAKFKPDCRGWADIVADMVRACGPDRLTVWTYDWLSSDPRRVLGLLAPGVAFTLPKGQQSSNVLPSLTVKGLNALEALKPHLSAAELKRATRMLRRFPFDEPNPKLEIADAGLIQAYEDKYQADLVRIRDLGVDLRV